MDFETQFDNQYPRLGELRRQAGFKGESYFDRLEGPSMQSSLAAEVFRNVEEELSQLSGEAWAALRQKCISCVTAPAPLRRWEQLFAALNEAKGYIFLKKLGYSDIRFIPESGMEKTPDLEAHGEKCDAVLEVKTLQRSDQDYEHIEEQKKRFDAKELPLVHSRSCEMPNGLASKFLLALEKATDQLMSHRPGDSLLRYAMMIVRLDDDPDAPSLFEEIDEGLRQLAEQYRRPQVTVIIHRPYRILIVGAIDDKHVSSQGLSLIRKTLTIISLLGLLLSVGAWTASYWHLHFISEGYRLWVSSG